MNYEKSFYLMGKKGNNAFSYERRGDEPRLFVPSVINGSLEDVRVGEEVVFEDMDGGLMQSCKGLKHFVGSVWEGIPLIVVDNHNHVFYFWYEAVMKGLLRRGATLIHVDQHKDAREPEQWFECGGLEDVFKYTNEVLNVGNYILPAQKEGLLGELCFVTGEADLDEKTFLNEADKILNIDLDFFAPGMEYIDFLKARAFILEHARTASLITVATSPFFIEQKRALNYLRKIFG